MILKDIHTIVSYLLSPALTGWAFFVPLCRPAMMNLIEQLKRHAGFYECVWYSGGRRLIGYGHDLNVEPLPEHLQRDFDNSPITLDEAEELLAADVMNLRDLVYQCLDLNQFNYVRQQAILSVAYWLTYPRFCRELQLISSLSKKDFKVSALIIAKKKPEFRAEELAKQILTGEY